MWIFFYKSKSLFGLHKMHMLYILWFVLDSPNCAVEYDPLGCYQAEHGEGNVFSELLINEISPQSSAFNRRLISFENEAIWKKKIAKLICRCAEVTFERGYPVFAIRNYGKFNQNNLDEKQLKHYINSKIELFIVRQW